MFYHVPPPIILLLKNQGILEFNNGSMITMALCNLHLEGKTLVIVWMYMTPSLIMINMVLQRVTLMMGNTKDCQIPLR